MILYQTVKKKNLFVFISSLIITSTICTYLPHNDTVSIDTQFCGIDFSKR